MESSTSSKANEHTNHKTTGEGRQMKFCRTFREKKKIIRSLDLGVGLQMSFMEEAAFELAFEIDVTISGCSLPNCQLVGGGGVYFINS